MKAKSKQPTPPDVAWIYKEQDPVHMFFGLSYASYQVLPRSILQSDPAWWQKRYVKLMEELEAMCEGLSDMPERYVVQVRDERGWFTEDPYCAYERGGRVVPLKRIKHI